MKQMNHKRILASIAFSAMVLIPAMMVVANSAKKTGVAFNPGTEVAASGTSNIFYSAIGTSYGGINISIDSTNTDRLNRVVNITVNATKMLAANGGPAGWNDVYPCYLNITYPNSTQRVQPMSEIGGSSTQIFKYAWTLTPALPVGTYTFKAVPNNGAVNWTDFNFTPASQMVVFNIKPWGFITTNTTEVYRNHTVAFNITVTDPETPYTQLVWNASLCLYNTTAPLKTWKVGDTFNQTHWFNGTSDTLLEDYYFRLIIVDNNNDKFDQNMAPITVRDDPPVINSVYYNHTAFLRRYTEVMFFEVNVTDNDNPWNATEVKIIFHKENSLVNVSSAALIPNMTTGNFTGAMNVTLDTSGQLAPTGGYTIHVIAKDAETLDSATVEFVPASKNATWILNNNPVMHETLINNQTLVNGTRFSQGQRLEFTVNASDIENEIDYIEIRLLYADGGNTAFNYYILSNTTYTLNISSSVLAPGTWYIYVIVVDFEADANMNTPAYTIVIDPDLRDMTSFAIWIALAAILGLVVGGWIIWRYANAKIADIRRDQIIKGKIKTESADAKKAKPGEKSSDKKYVDPASAKAAKKESDDAAKAPEKKPDKATEGASKPAEKKGSDKPAEKKGSDKAEESKGAALAKALSAKKSDKSKK